MGIARRIGFILGAVAASFVAMAAPGDPDPTLGVGGVQLIDFGGPASVTITAAARNSTGRIIVAGQVMGTNGRLAVAIGSLNADGSRDSFFGTSGWAVVGDNTYDLSPTAVAIAADNSIRVFGKAASNTFVARMNANGMSDGLNGVNVDFISAAETVRAVTVGADGYTFLVAGTCDAPFGSAGTACVVQYNYSGYREGKVNYDVGGSRSEATAILRNPGNGDLFLAGYVEDYAGNNRDMFVTRIGADAAIVPAFGVRIIDFGNRDEASALVLRDGAHLVVAGTTASGAVSMIATASMSASNGQLDEFSWGQGGKAVTPMPYHGAPSSVHVASMFYSSSYLMPDSFYATVTVRSSDQVYPQPSQMATVRFDRSGNLYPVFGNGYGAATVLNAPGDADMAVAGFEIGGPQVVTVGSRMTTGALLVARQWLDNGSLDNAFGMGGVLTAQPYAPSQDQLVAFAAVRGDNADYVGVRSGNNGVFQLFRARHDGMLDTAFGTNGTVNLQPGSYRIAVQLDGSILTTHEVTLPGTSRIGVALERWLPGGQPDASFGSGGRVTIDLGGSFALGYGVVEQADFHRIVVALATGNSGSGIRMALARFNSDGTADSSFAGGVVVIGAASDEEPRGLVIQPDGRIVVGGLGANGWTLYRRLGNGAPDPSWANGGAATAVGCTPSLTSNIALSFDGRVIVGGILGPESGSHPCVARFLASGAPDEIFGYQGVRVVPAPSGYVGMVAVDADNRILATTSNSVVRLFPDGGLDGSFGGGFVSIPNIQYSFLLGLLRHSDERIVAFGTAMSFGDYDVLLARFEGGGPPPDDTPVPFTFTDVANVPSSTVITSNTVIITGMSVPVAVTVTGGTYSIGCTGTFTASPGEVSNGGTVCVRHTSASTPGTATNTTLTAGGVSDTFTSVTTPAVPPDTTITSGPSDPTPLASTSATFSFTSNEAGATFQCSLDNAPFTACASPKTYDNLIQGGHLFNVRAVGAFGTIDPTPARSIFTVDTSPPDTTITSGTPPQHTNVTGATFIFTSNDANATFECRLDNAAFASCSSPMTYSGLADGNHSFFVRATDAAGNVDPSPAQAFWSVDTVAPDTSFNTFPPPSGIIAASQLNIYFGTNEAATFECRLNGAAWAACTSPRTLNFGPQNDGAYTFEVRAVDLAGNADATPATASWINDLTVPDTTIDSAPSALTSSQNAAFTFSTADANPNGFECALDAESFVPCTSPKTYGGLAEGAHTFRVRARDGAGFIDSSPAQHAWTIDLTSPNTLVTSGPALLTGSIDAVFTFQSEAGATFECSLDGAAFAACATPVAYASLADGTHQFRVRAIDNAGNLDPTPGEFTWTVDTTPSDTLLVFTPLANPTNASSFTASMGFSIEPITFECRLDGGAWFACPSPYSQSGLADGTHTFEVRSKDAAGNVDPTPATRTWVIDTVAPDTSIAQGPSGTVAANSALFSFASTEAPALFFECSLDGAAFSACGPGLSLSGLAQGAHTLQVRAKDLAGNVDATPASRTWSVDTQAPETTINGGPSGAVASTSASFTYSANEAGATFQCSLDGGAYSNCPASGQAYAGLAQGTHTFAVRATDAVGNVDATSASRTWVVDTVVPDTTITGGPSGNNNPNTATFTFTSTESGTFECKLDTGSFASCASGITYSNLAKGDHAFQVRAIDAAGNVDATPATRTWRSK